MPLKISREDVEYILTPRAVRDVASRLLRFTEEGKGNFNYHPEKLRPASDYVLQVIRKNYPDLKIPFHSRWGHFRAGSIDRVKLVDEKLKGVDPLERARAKLDLAVTSVLLDAGAGASWRYLEDGKPFARSEGLGVASLHLFLAGAFASDGNSPRADEKGLKSFTAGRLRQGFQVDESNPLLGVDGRVGLINHLGGAVSDRSRFRDGRPGNLLDDLMSKHGNKIPAPAILQVVLEGFGSIWPGRLSAQGVNLGDVWCHSAMGAAGTRDSLVPFHKLSQWMTYSLIEPILEAGCEVTGVEDLTGLAEYRNGGLMVDSGLISLKDPSLAARKWEPSSELVIEWRALTVALLDKIGVEVQKSLGMDARTLPLAKVLEGGTWWAGRFLAAEKRAGGEPPLQIVSDGTVF